MARNEKMIKVTNEKDGAVYWTPAANEELADIMVKAYKRFTEETGAELKVETFTANHMEMKDLPEEVQADIMETCGAFRQANVEYANGEFKVMAGTYCAASYPNDMFIVGTWKQEDVYSPEELKEVHKRIFGYAC